MHSISVLNTLLTIKEKMVKRRERERETRHIDDDMILKTFV